MAALTRLEHACLLALGRAPKPEESRRLNSYFAQQRALFAADPEAARDLSIEAVDGDATERAAWTALSSVLMNLDEFLNRE